MPDLFFAAAANLGSGFGFFCVILGLILYMFGVAFGLAVLSFWR